MKKLFTKTIIVGNVTYYMTNKNYKKYRKESAHIKIQNTELFELLANYSYSFKTGIH